MVILVLLATIVYDQIETRSLITTDLRKESHVKPRTELSADHGESCSD